MFTDITVKELIPLSEKKKMVLIDVRSPSEFQNFSIPESINIPFFDDAERAEIGTLYKQASVEAAKVRGLEIISAKLPEFVRQFKQIEGNKTVFCWRGGMRSRTTATLLSLMDVHVNRLEGGIREYRRWVINQLEQPEAPFKAYVLNGLTGTGKTRILKALEKQGYPVIDLEGLANHKGSIFGHIGVEPNNQKKFDSLFVQQFRELQKAPFVLFEAESARIGKVVIPNWVTELKANSVQLIIDMPMEERIKEIIEDYRPVEYQAECIAAFQRIKTRMPQDISKQIESDLETGEFDSAVRLLLEYYYDSRYKHTGLQYPDQQKKMLQVQNLEEAIEAIKRQIPEIEKSPAGNVG
ncbi:tRNA 2-selenouridine(34) synthase MnmH [Planococcus soli]|uniref:tRNA 2-selenouridine(34) synthase MnmH n=1 Tax=Planococcus soli TaxID=2666072 RepID=UPI00115E1437|nr:tRNA 2-selenouridine(34) synthase MnmH [Planococcus soli]